MKINPTSGLATTPDTKRRKIPTIFLVFLLVFFVLFAVGMYGNTLPNPNWTRISGQVVSSHYKGRSYYLKIAYSVNGQEYLINDYSRLPQIIGQNRELAYNPAKPSEARVVLSPAQIRRAVIGSILFTIPAAIILFVIIRRITKPNK